MFNLNNVIREVIGLFHSLKEAGEALDQVPSKLHRMQYPENTTRYAEFIGLMEESRQRLGIPENEFWAVLTGHKVDNGNDRSVRTDSGSPN